MAFTLTELLTQRATLRLYGRKLSDLSPRGDLGLGLAPEGPVGFALIRACSRAGVPLPLPQALILSVFGEGDAPEAHDAQALPGERVWLARRGDLALQLQLRQAPLGTLLQPAAADAASDGFEN